MSCCICGTVKNCAKYLPKVLENMEKIGSIFDDYKILLYYDVSNDGTLQVLKKYKLKNPKFSVFVNKSPLSKYRTHNLAKGRNFCLEYVKKNKNKYSYFIMMDCDDVNHKNVNLDVLKKHIKNNEGWDGLSFNTTPKYYDIWGLSIYPYCFSYNHFNDGPKFYGIIQNYIDILLKRAKTNNTLLRCMSSFNGFSIYKLNMFMDTYYDGTVRLDLIPKHLLNAHEHAANSHLVYPDYGNVNARYEDCEHRAFHIQAIRNSGARIMITPDILFY